MPFPDSPREIYDHNPLVEVICQLRFPAILSIASEPPAAFQEMIRADYPHFRTEQSLPGLPPEIASQLEGLPVPPGSETTYVFENEDRTRSIHLAKEFVAVTETSYSKWEDFRGEVERAKSALEECYQPAPYERVGLRYRDVINRSELGLQASDWSDLLNPALAGFLAADDEVANDLVGFTEAAQFRVADVEHAFARVQHGIVEVVEDEDIDLKAYSIDVDFFTSERSQSQDVIPTLNIFHVHAGNFFRWAIEEPLRNALGPSELE